MYASGVRQAVWLTKSKLISGLPPQLLSMANSCTNQIPDQDERVQNAIKHARFWDTTEERPGKKKYRFVCLAEFASPFLKKKKKMELSLEHPEPAI